MAITLQVATRSRLIPSRRRFAAWVAAAQRGAARGGAVTVRVVGRAEMTALNQRYRGRASPTNVLAFPFDGSGAPPHVAQRVLGDVVLCAPRVVEEAKRGGITRTAHWAHLVIHGTLHLCGYDHDHAAAANRMESLERDILAAFGIPHPTQPPRLSHGTEKHTGALASPCAAGAPR